MEWLLKAGDKFYFMFLLILTLWVEQGLRQYIMTLRADSFCSNLALLNSEYSLGGIYCSSEYWKLKLKLQYSGWSPTAKSQLIGKDRERLRAGEGDKMVR